VAVEPARALVAEMAAHCDFLAVYVLEAHSSDHWPLGFKRSDVPQHRSLEERLEVARRWSACVRFPFEMVVDTMSNEFNARYAAWPERLHIIDEQGRIALIQLPLPYGDGSASVWSDDVRDWWRARCAAARGC
jgi:hypothetical protein